MSGVVWRRVVGNDDVGPDGLCPECGRRYKTCPCPGPDAPDLFAYRTHHGRLEARPLTEAEME